MSNAIQQPRLMSLSDAYPLYQQGATIHFEDDFGMFSVQALHLHHSTDDFYLARFSHAPVVPVFGEYMVLVSWGSV